MGTCLSKKKEFSSTSSNSASTVPEVKNSSGNAVTVSKPKVETEPEVKLKKENNTVHVQEKHESVQEDAGHVKKEIFIIKHRKSHDDRERNSKSPPNIPQQNFPSTYEESELMDGKNIAAEAVTVATNMGMGVRTSSCTKEEVDAILIHCGRLSRSSSSAAAASSGEKHRRKYSGSKRSFDFDHCDNDNDTVSTEEDQKKANANHNDADFCEDSRQHRPRRRHSPSPRPSSQERRRRTPSREREQQQQSRERRVSRSPGRRSSETTTSANARNNSSNNNSSRPGKMVSVPATVSSLVMDKSNNGGGGGDSAATAGVKRITVKRNVGTASPRSQSPARANGNGGNGNKAFGENQQQQPSLSRNSSRKESPYRRNPLSEMDPNSLAFPHSTANINSSRVQNKPKKELEAESNQKPSGSRTALDKGVSGNYKTKVQQEEDVKVHSSMTDNVVVKTVIPPEVDSLKPQTLTRSRSSRRSRDFDLNTDAPLVPPQSYTSLLLEDIQNFHQKNTPSVSLPACVTKACSILEAVADLNSNSNSNFQQGKNENNIQLSSSTNSYGKKELDANEPVVESMLFVNDDMMEPSLHKYVTVNRGGSLNGVDMEDQESSGSNSFTVSSGQNHWGISNSSSWEPNSVDSKDCWGSRLNYTGVEGQKNPLGLEGLGVDGAKEKLISKRRECDHEHASGIGRSRFGNGTNKVIPSVPVVTAAASR